MDGRVADWVCAILLAAGPAIRNLHHRPGRVRLRARHDDPVPASPRSGKRGGNHIDLVVGGGNEPGYELPGFGSGQGIRSLHEIALAGSGGEQDVAYRQTEQQIEGQSGAEVGAGVW